MKDPKDAREGEWDFDGACAPAAVYAGARAYCKSRNRIQFLVPGAAIDGLWTNYPFFELGDTPHGRQVCRGQGYGQWSPNHRGGAVQDAGGQP